MLEGNEKSFGQICDHEHLPWGIKASPSGHGVKSEWAPGVQWGDSWPVMPPGLVGVRKGT